MEKTSNNAAKYAFFYMLSLVALVFMALSTGMVVFQIINKNIVDVLKDYGMMYNSEALKFAISAIIISSPVYFLLMWQINKSLFDGRLSRESGVRKWLTYFILFVSSVVVIGWLIGTIYSYLDGELTMRFVLKSLTSILIAGAVFSYYFYDIKRETVVGAKDKVMTIYAYGSMLVVLAALVSAFVFVESPRTTREIKQDMALLSKFDKIDSAINAFVNDEKKLPASLDELRKKQDYILESDLKNPADGQNFDYKASGKSTYEICSTFFRSNKDMQDSSYNGYLNSRWPHDAGKQCIKREVDNTKDLIDKLDAEKAASTTAPAKTVPVARPIKK